MDQLFEWDGVKKPAAPEHHSEPLTVKLEPPWILIAMASTRPRAHLPHPIITDVRQGSVFARCTDDKPVGRRLEVDGAPVVPVCDKCYLVAARTGLLT